MGLFDKFKKNSKNVKKENEKINTSSGNLFDEKPKDALTNNMNFDEKLGTYVIEIKGIIFESGTEQGDTYISSLDKVAKSLYQTSYLKLFTSVLYSSCLSSITKNCKYSNNAVFKLSLFPSIKSL